MVLLMTGDRLTDGVASTALLQHVASGSEYLGEIALGLLGKLSDADLLAEVRALEMQQRAIQTAWHALAADLEQRGLAARVGAPNTAALLRGMLQLSPHEATARVKAAAVLGPRVSLDGQQLEPLLPAVTAAQGRGEVSVEQAKVIAAVLDQVPGSVPLEQFTRAEQQLVDAAQSLPPKQVGDVGKRILAYLDPDGVLPSDAEHQRRREFMVTALSDGSYRANGYLTPTCGAQILAVLDAHAAPTPAEDGTRDPRTHGQRMHDALKPCPASPSGATSYCTEMVRYSWSSP